MNLHERVLSVLGCRYVDDVLIDAPYEITRDMISHLNIGEVVRGVTRSDLGNVDETDARYRYAREAGIFTLIDSRSTFSIASIVRRIQKNHEAFQARFVRKMEKESKDFEDKHQSSGNASSIFR